MKRGILEEIDYDEIVTFVRATGERQIMSLAEAVRAVMNFPGLRERVRVRIIRDEEKPVIKLMDIEAIYANIDFPNSH